MFSADVSAHDLAGATAWDVVNGAPAFSDTQMHMTIPDAVTITPAAHLDSQKGSVTFQYTRESDTDDIEILVECGIDGYDWLRVYVDGDSDQLVLWWATGGALPQHIESAQTIAVDTRYFVSCAWQHTAMSLSVGALNEDGIADALQTVTGTRDVPMGAWNSDDLVVLAGDLSGAYGAGDYGDDLYGA